MTNQSTLQINQQLPTKLSDQRIHIESRTVSQSRRTVSFGAIVVIRVFEEQHNPSLAWYSKRELMKMRRDYKTLSKHYNTLSQRHPDMELLGLEDARAAKERSISRKLQIQYIILLKMTNQSAIDISQQIPTKLSDQRIHIESRTISQAQSKVSFGAIVAIRVFEKQDNPSLAWYSKRELMKMRRDYKTLSKHYNTLSQRHPDMELLGLEDARAAKERSISRKLHIQYILLQQDFHRLFTHDVWNHFKECLSITSAHIPFSRKLRATYHDPMEIMDLPASYSKHARHQAISLGASLLCAPCMQTQLIYYETCIMRGLLMATSFKRSSVEMCHGRIPIVYWAGEVG